MRASLDKPLFGSIVHGRPALEFLISSCGAERVLLGSDNPFDIGTLECARQVETRSIAEADKATILGDAAMRLLALSLDRLSLTYLLAEEATFGLAKGLYPRIG